MHKLSISVALTGAAFALAACSQEAAEPADTETPVAVETATAAVDGVIDANAAAAEELVGVDGINPELAAAIVVGQPYASITDLNAVLMNTLTEAEAADVRENVFVLVNLNTATREELELIPGIDDRMVHEFEEYVPYEDMAEFDREIGKYVDEAEVARYRRYVTL